MQRSGKRCGFAEYRSLALDVADFQYNFSLILVYWMRQPTSLPPDARTPALVGTIELCRFVTVIFSVPL
jgi:hypothetical protein